MWLAFWSRKVAGWKESVVAVWFLLSFGFFLDCFFGCFCFCSAVPSGPGVPGSPLLDVISRLRKRGRQEAKQVKSFLGVLLAEDRVRPLRPEDAK